MTVFQTKAVANPASSAVAIEPHPPARNHVSHDPIRCVSPGSIENSNLSSFERSLDAPLSRPAANPTPSTPSTPRIAQPAKCSGSQ